MKKTLLHSARHHILTPIRNFLQDSRAIGIILIGCTAISLLLSNMGATQHAYISFFQDHIIDGSGPVAMPENMLGWINDVLMTFFFFLVGMEIKRELMVGELASIKKSLLPVLAALGGMVVPALIFTFFNGNTDFHHGWGIPMATDIAFSLGVLSLLGKKVPVQLKIFLAALAIIDDLGAVITIAMFYTSKIQIYYLLGAFAAAVSAVLLNVFKVNKIILYLIPGLALWYCLFNSGVHPTIAGVVMAFSMPLSQLEKLQKILFNPVNFFIMPLFALANTAIVLPSQFGAIFSSSISFGIILGLTIGKPVGILLFSYIGTKSGLAALPSHTTFKQLLGVGMLGGIGFTMSIFTSTLAYQADSLQVISKVCIIAASIVSSLIGYVYLRRFKFAAVDIPLTTEALDGTLVYQQIEAEELVTS